MTIDIDFRKSAENQAEIEQIVRSAVLTTLSAQGETEKIELSVVITDDEDMRAINASMRSVDETTDVLSFPMLEYDDMQDEGATLLADELFGETNPETGEILLGDIVINYDRTVEQAAEFGHSFARELGYLTVHAMLHLLGYDHIAAEDKRIMREREEFILDILQLKRE